jgi:hypothetical protein
MRVKFYVELEFSPGEPVSDRMFDALADALADLDAAAPDISDAGLGASLAEGWGTSP